MRTRWNAALINLCVAVIAQAAGLNVRMGASFPKKLTVSNISQMGAAVYLSRPRATHKTFLCCFLFMLSVFGVLAREHADLPPVGHRRVPLVASPEGTASVYISEPDTELRPESGAHTGAQQTRVLLQATQAVKATAEYVCSLQRSKRDRYLNVATRTWLLDASVLEEIENDLQLIVNCTRAGDVLVFDTTKTIQPSSRTIIPWPLLLSSYVDTAENANGFVSRSSTRARFTCPRNNEGLFSIRATNVTFANFVLEGCSFNLTQLPEPPESIVKIEACASKRNKGTVRLNRVTFRRNYLNGAAAIWANGPSCSVLEIEGLNFQNNSCGGACGVVLAGESKLQKIRIIRNRAVRPPSSRPLIIYAPSESVTHADQVNAFKNDCPIFEIQNGTLYLSNANFSRNSSVNLKSRTSACIVLREASASIQGCTFQKNKAWYGVAISASQSEVVAENCAFWNNAARRRGTLYLKTRSSLVVHSCGFFSNWAKLGGGAIYASETNGSIVNMTCTGNEAGSLGGCIYMSRSDSLELSDSILKRNHADSEGGSVFLLNSTSTLTDCIFEDNWSRRGGAVSLQRSWLPQVQGQLHGCLLREKSGILEESGCPPLDAAGAFINITFVNNSASWSGGAVEIDDSTVNLTQCTFLNGSSGEGGFVHVLSNTSVAIYRSSFNGGSVEDYGGCLESRSGYLILERTVFENCQAFQTGGAMLLEIEAAIIRNSSFLSNWARFGGGAIRTATSGVRLVTNVQTSITIRDSLFKDNSAENGGAVLHQLDIGNFINVQFVNNSASGDGGSIFARSDSLSLRTSTFSDGNASNTGGFLSVAGTRSVLLEGISMTRGKAANGGAIFLSSSTFKARHLSVSHCRAEMGGGALKAEDSAVLCVDCKVERNSAREEGGAILFQVGERQELVLQLQRTDIQSNMAKTGAGLHFVSNYTPANCSDPRNACAFAAVVNTRFEENRAALAGGAIFIGYLSEIRFSCAPAQRNASLDFLEEPNWGILSKLTSHEDLCPSWKGNQAGVYGPTVASYAALAKMTVEYEGTKTEVLSGEVHVVEGYVSGTQLPALTVQLFDGLRQGPPISYYGITAALSAPDTLVAGDVSVHFLQDTVVFPSMIGFGPPGVYNMTIAFNNRAIRNLTVTIVVRNCIIGEVTIGEAKICSNCSSSTYNFMPGAQECLPCPTNGNCQSNVIIPEDGYWQDSPCSAHVDRCLTSHACKFEGRVKSLEDVTKDMRSCNIDSSRLMEYQRVQCAQGHSGPLCGSCQTTYASSLSWRCKECPMAIGNAAVICTSVVILLGLSGVTIRGTLNTPSIRRRMLSGQKRISRSIQLSDFSLASRCERTEAEVSTERPEDSADKERIEGLLATEATLAQWKAVEMLKITLSYIQVTVLIASLDVGWPISVLTMAEIAEFLGGLAVESTRRSVVCLSKEDQSLHPTAWALIVSVCVVPICAFLLLTLFWTAAALYCQVQRPLRYLAKRFLLSLMVLWYITSVPVIKTTLSTGLCVNAHNILDATREGKEVSYWAVDTSLKCFKDDHLALALSIISFVSVVYGGLLILFVCILASEEQLTDSDSWIYETTGFLYRSYKLGCRRYWEVAIVVRKAIIAFLVFCAHRFDSQLPIIGVAVFITLAIVGQILAMPYRQRFDVLNKMDTSALFISLLTTLLASMLKNDSFTEDWGRLILSAAGGMLNVISFVVFVSFLSVYFADYLKFVLTERGTHFDSGAGRLHVLKIWLNSEIRSLFAGIRSDKPHDLSSLSSGM